jgi:hypothetical protein
MTAYRCLRANRTSVQNQAEPVAEAQELRMLTRYPGIGLSCERALISRAVPTSRDRPGP